MSTALLFLFVSILALSWPMATRANDVYQTGEAFIAESFAQPGVHSGSTGKPASKSLWLTPAIKEAASDIMNRPVQGLRVRYWQSGGRTAWIMDEIGKELPITIGVIIEQNQVKQVKILAFRESRGWEVRYPAFTAQYQGAKMTPEYRLDRQIDGITGATLSVRATTRVATLALFYHRQAMMGSGSNQ